MHRSRFARHLCLAVDTKGYGGRDNVAQYNVQRDLLNVMDEAAAAADLDRSQWNRQAQGDGEIALLPPGQPEPRVVDDFTRELGASLALLNYEKRQDARLRLRVAVHFGVAYEAPSGFAGDAVVITARLLGSVGLHRALEEADDADLAVALSDRVYTDTVLPRHTSLQPRQFIRVEIAEKEYVGAAWIRALSGGAAAPKGDDHMPARGRRPGHPAPEPGNVTEAFAGVQNNFYGDVRDAGVIGISVTDPEWRR